MTRLSIEKNNNLPIKIALMGGSGSGKTQLCTALEGKEYHPDFFPSMGMEFSRFNNIFDYEICTIPGALRYKLSGFIQGLIPNTVKNSDIIIICIDPSERDSFKEAWYYAREIRKVDTKAPIVIAFTQLDKNLRWRVADEEIDRFKLYYGITNDTIGTSAAQGEEGIKELRALTLALKKKLRGDPAEPDTMLTLNDVLLNIENFCQMAKAGLSELMQHHEKYLKKRSPLAKLPPKLQKACLPVQNLIVQLEKAKDIPKHLCQVSEIEKKNALLDAYQQAVGYFVEKVNKNVLKVKPPQHILNVILRLLRAPFIGFRMYNDHELKELRRFEQQTSLKEALQGMKTSKGP
ncbi:GTPase domain-containing protein [Legionella sp. PATHC035]|uniref:GTPase domain-containing protein n=1 Tax=Legionella sp. PATHC035 TaxID=2992040 RepID=UPI0022433CF3|nr:GTPase domain-containing protein [Legionella sp. PATHC035]MCW8410182.1 GTPase domain-containing protein [Legionella sp. PATHC035]